MPESGIEKMEERAEVALARGGGLWLLSPQRFSWRKAWPAKLWH